DSLLPLPDAVYPQQACLTNDGGLLLRHFSGDNGIDVASFVFQRDEDDALGSSRTLSGHNQTAGSGQTSVRVLGGQCMGRLKALVPQGFSQKYERMITQCQARALIVGQCLMSARHGSQ